MAALFWTIVALVLILTGAIVPILIFGGWALVVVLIVALLGLIVAKIFGLLIRPFAMIGADVAEALAKPKYPPPDHPDYVAYLDWTNRRGEFGTFEHWEDVKRVLAVRQRSNLDRKKWEQNNRNRRRQIEQHD